MSDLRELYQEVILEHNRNPRNFRELGGDALAIEGFNPLCGDHYTLYVDFEGDVIRDIAFLGSGCAISKASASVMTSSVKGKTKGEAEVLFRAFHDLVTGESKPEDVESLSRIAAFSGVSEFPARVKCASLAWHTLTTALRGEATVVSTE